MSFTPCRPPATPSTEGYGGDGLALPLDVYAMPSTVALLSILLDDSAPAARIYEGIERKGLG